MHVGILFAILYVALSATSPERLPYGAALVIAGETIRVWACGHLERNKVIARRGPYALVRHPLYVGSLLIGTGLAFLTLHVTWWLPAFVALYVGFYMPAMHIEELRLQSLFGAEYHEYMADVPRLLPRMSAIGSSTSNGRRFEWSRAVGNREMRTIAVMAALLLVQLAKLWQVTASG